MAQLSPLAVVSNSIPPNGNGTVTPFSWYDQNNSGVFISAAGAYVCDNSYSQAIIPLTSEDDYDDPVLLYIAKTSTFRFLHFQDSLRAAHEELRDYYDGLWNSSIRIFTQIDSLLSEKLLDEAEALNNSVEVENEVEANYKTYFSLYLKYLKNEELEEDDGYSLKTLALKCPGRNGAIIFQARSLHEVIYNAPVIGEENCGDFGDRKSFRNDAPGESTNSIKVYPNPASENIVVETNHEHDWISIKIFDLSGRVIFAVKTLKPGKTIDVPINLSNGAYLLQISSSDVVELTRKLIICR